MTDLNTLEAVEKLAPEAMAEFVGLVTHLNSGAALASHLHEVEDETNERGRELLRSALQAHIKARGDGDVGKALVSESRPVRVDGDETPNEPSGALVLLSHRRSRHRAYKSRFGWIDVDRLGYGNRGEYSIVPLDEDLSLPKRNTGYPVQKEICTEVARGPYMEAARALERQGVPVAAANVDKIAQDAACDFVDFYADTTPSPGEETSEILVAAIDCKGIRIRGLPEIEPTAKDPGRTGKKKMATVAAVYTIEPYVRTPEEIVGELRPKRPLKVVSPRPRPRPRPEAKRVWASLKKSKDDIFNEVALEIWNRDPYGTKTQIALTDGEKALQQRALLLDLILILDIFHVIEYLWEIARAFYPRKKNGKDQLEAKEWMSKRLLWILQGNVSTVVRGVRQSATKRKLRGKKLEAVSNATRYFMNNREFMRYDEYLATGYPIGSGAAEGACRHLINDRLERTGMTWSEDGAEAVLKLRAIEISGDTDAYWEYHLEREHERLYTSRPWAIAA
jgi:hypothetical protein